MDDPLLSVASRRYKGSWTLYIYDIYYTMIEYMVYNEDISQGFFPHIYKIVFREN